MKHTFRIVAILMMMAFTALSASAQGGDAFLQITGPGGTRTAQLDPSGNAKFDNVKPGTYSVGLLLPAVQKVREAASRSSTAAAEKDHKNWIDIQSWSWGATNMGTSGHGGGGGAGKVSVHDISVTKSTDATNAPPNVAQPVPPSRKQLGDKTTHNGQEYYKVELKEVMVSSIAGSSPGSGDRPTESLSLNFTKITYRYAEQ